MYFDIKLGSITTAQRAIRLLKSRGYRPMLHRLENPSPADGCGYAIKLYAENENRVLSILKNNGINVIGVESR